MTKTEKRLAVYFLDQLSDKQGNAGCNDLETELVKMLSEAEKEQMVREYGQYNGDPQEPRTFNNMLDFMIVGLLTHKFRQEIDAEG
jgi:hypothetical protein